MKKVSTEKRVKRPGNSLPLIIVLSVILTIVCLLLYPNHKPIANSGTYKDNKFTPVVESLHDETISDCPTLERIQNPAKFPHGINAWRKYLEKNLVYPEAAINHNTEGVVRVQMVVEKDGSISDVIPLNDLGYGLANEAVRVIQSGPGWIPARHKGKPVTYRFIQTITFELK